MVAITAQKTAPQDPADKLTNNENVNVVNTQDEAVESWLALPENQGINLSNLSQSDLRSLIAHLESFKKQPWAKSQDFKDLLSDLKVCEKNWIQANSSGNDLTMLNAKLLSQNIILDAIKNFVPKSEFTAAKGAVTSQLSALEDLIEHLKTMDSGDWSAIDGDKTVAELTTLIQKIENLVEILEGQDINGKSIDGLNQFKTDLQTALTTYEAAMQEALKAEDPELAQKIALSDFKENTANAKLSYYNSIGMSNQDPLYVAELNAVERENIWQNTLQTKWSSDSVPQPQDNSVEGLEDYLTTLQGERQRILEKGGSEEERRTALAYIDGKIKITDRAVRAGSGGSHVEQMGAFVDFYDSMQTFEINQMEINRLAALESAGGENVSADDKAAFTKLATEIEAEQEKIRVILKAVMDTVGNIYSGLQRFEQAAANAV
jgi:hypothetical protein